MDELKIKSGYIPSKPDHRNYNVSRLVAPVNVFPEEFELDISNIEIEDQGNVGCCVAEGACYHMAYSYKDLFSQGFIYGNRDDSDYLDHGMYPNEMLKHLKNEGCVLRKDFPLLEEMPDIRDEVLKVKPQLLPKASQYKIASYAELNGESDIKNALMQLKTPVIIGINVYLTFLYPMADGFVPSAIPELMKTSYGGHMVTLYGWDKRGWKILNSWGKGEWTKDGKCVLDYEYGILEAWAISDKVSQPPQPTPVNKWWRLQVGAYKSKDSAIRRGEEMKKLGYNYYIVNVDGLFKCQLGAFSIEQNCRNLSSLLKSKGIDNFVTYY